MKERFLTGVDYTEVRAEIALKSDIVHSHDWDSITSKPSFHSISVTGDYEELENKPVMFSGSYTDLSNKPTFHDICFSGSYLDLLDTPLAVDMDEIFTRLDDLDDFVYRKMPAIPNVTNAPVATSVTILGIQIPSANSFSNLIGDYNDLRDSHNRLLSAARSWGWLDS